MTVPSSGQKVIYSGNGSTVDFNLPTAYFLDDTGNFEVWLRDESVSPVTESQLVEGALNDFVFTGQNVLLGIVATAIQTTFTPTAQEKILIRRVVSLGQPTDLVNDVLTPMDTFESTYDLLAMQIEQIKEELNRTPKFANTSSTGSKSIDDPVAGSGLIWGATGNIESSQTLGDLNTAVTAAQAAQAAAEASATSAAGSATTAAAAAAAAVAAHEADTTAHPASSIVNTPAGTIGSTDVQAALNELDGDIQGHITDTTAAHGASAISNTPSGNLAATDVQGALDELQTDVDGRVAKSTLTTKGDLFAATGAGAVARLAATTNNYVLTLDSSQSTGMKWAPASGGGGGSLQWVEYYDSPTPVVENGFQLYTFALGVPQALYAAIRVPSGYTAGQQIKLRTLFYSPDSSGTALMQTITTLIRTGTDAITSTTNQRTSTNTAVTLGAGTVDKPQAITCDLSDASGAINSVAVSAGDLILVQLQRGSDSATSDLKIPVYATEVTFNG